jgi:hypothetical protein
VAARAICLLDYRGGVKVANIHVWVWDNQELTEGHYREATQSEIDSAASEQMRHDAEVGRAVRDFPKYSMAVLCYAETLQPNKLWFVRRYKKGNDYSDPEHYKSGFSDTPRLALLAAGLLEEVTP